LPGLSASALVTDDMGVTNQLRHVLVHATDGGIQKLFDIDLRNGTATSWASLNSLPTISRQMYTHPYRGCINYTWYSGGSGGEAFIDMTPVTWSPPQQPQVNVTSLSSPPTDAADVFPPPPVAAALITPLPAQPGDAPGALHLSVSGLEPGATVFVDAQAGDLPVEPTEGQADDDGFCDDLTLILNTVKPYCFYQIDPAGNASPPTCVAMTPTLSVDGLPSRLSFALAGANPAHGEARFSLAMPAAGRVQLKIYDVSGRLVRRVTDQAMSVGTHTLSWDLRSDAGRASPGVFFARLTTLGQQIDVRVVAMH
jgi:hypothetical protein